ncbi:hypothetical protein MTO96_050350 [Rhipicephalus appendiculatus]
MERLRRKRTTVRAAVTRIINEKTTLMQTEPTPTEEPPLSNSYKVRFGGKDQTFSTLRRHSTSLATVRIQSKQKKKLSV